MKKNTSAFSLIETIIAITVIGLVITAAASLTQGSVRIGYTTTNQLRAYHLAEEGLEIVRNVRDSNWMQNKKWRDQFAVSGMYSTLPSLNGFRLESIGSEVAAEQVKLSDQTFSRYIQVADGPDDSVRVKSVVQYIEKGTQKKAEITMDLTNWKKGPL